jgi:DNA-binding winged helix-turn-helix (wHTH) protein/energy-coupling factor transporter ATP-binding protein EcfA2
MHIENERGAVEIRAAERVLFQQGRPLKLGARAFDLLLALVERRDRVVSKDELLALVWPGLVVEEGNLSVQISALRKALGEHAITTVPGRGYRFTAPMAEAPAGLAPPSRATGHAADPPPDSGPSAGPLGWLPAATTPLLGRTDALMDLQNQLDAARCLTLVGAGGSGKTRLALALAGAVRGQFRGGVWWVGLDALSDPALLAQAVAGAVGGVDQHLPPLPALCQRLSGRKTLLVLDNCEHLVEACSELASQLLRHLPDLQLLCTSRETLRIAGEGVWPVPTLKVPELADFSLTSPAGLEALSHVPSVQLLVERIRQHSPSFVLTPGNAPALVQVCRRLEGLPLALELVAAQVGPRTVDQVAAQLDHSLGLMNVGPRGGMRHHQTMVAAIDWGFRLLSEADQTVFLRLSVFHGGWTLDRPPQPTCRAFACWSLCASLAWQDSTRTGSWTP